MAVTYKTEVIDLAIGNLNVSIELITNIDELFDELASRDATDPEVKDERIPYWAELWPSSICMANYIVKNPQLFKGKDVIELGCGLGLSGIVAGKSGAKVVLTDYQQAALDWAEKNWKRNNNEVVHTAILDWRHADLKEKFDLIIAADVAYESKMFKPLIQTILKLLKPGGMVLITEPNRKFAKEFIVQLKEKKFTVETQTEKIDFRGIPHTVHLHIAKL